MFSIQNPLNGLEDSQDYKILVCHVHGKSHKYFTEYLEYIQNFGVEKLLLMGSIGLKNKLENLGIADNLIYSLFLNSQSFAKYDVGKLRGQINEAQKMILQS